MRRFVLSVIAVILLGLAALALPGRTQSQDGWEVSGKITLDSKPLEGMDVFLYGPSSSGAVTDAQGSYRIKGVVPGTYRIVVQKKEDTSAPEPRTVSLAGGIRLRVDFRMTTGSVISGRVLDVNRRPVAGLFVEAFQKAIVDRRLRMYAQGVDKTNDLGEYRIPFLPEGTYVIAIHSEPLRMKKRDADSNPSPGPGYPSFIFYPGTPDSETADVLELRDGAERAGINFVLEKATATCVFFKIGKGFASGRIRASLRKRVGFEAPAVSDGQVAAGESYEVCGLVPGEYELSVTALGEGTKQEFPGSIDFGRNLQLVGYEMMTAVVGEEKNVDLGVVEPLPVSDAKGTVTIVGAQPGDAIPSGVRVRIVASQLRAQFTDIRPAMVQTDGTFVLRQVFAGDYGVRVDLPPGPYYLIGAYQQTRNVVDEGFHPANGDLQIKLGSDGCQLAGRVLAEDGSAVPDASVFLVPGQPGSHRVAQSDQIGAFSFTGIPPGEYRFVAAQGVLGRARADAATAARLAGHGKELKLNPREARIIDVKVQPVR